MDWRVRQRGFTLRELIVVGLLLATLSGALATRFARARTATAEASCEENAARINQTIELWYFTRGSWPVPDLSDIIDDPSYFPAGLPCCPLAGEPYIVDPATHRVIPHHH